MLLRKGRFRPEWCQAGHAAAVHVSRGRECEGTVYSHEFEAHSRVRVFAALQEVVSLLGFKLASADPSSGLLRTPWHPCEIDLCRWREVTDTWFEGSSSCEVRSATVALEGIVAESEGWMGSIVTLNATCTVLVVEGEFKMASPCSSSGVLEEVLFDALETRLRDVIAGARPGARRRRPRSGG